MGSSDIEIFECILEYAKQNDISIDVDGEPLGIGEDGAVWESSRLTAVKVFYRERNYLAELKCYERLANLSVTEVAGFAVPELISFSDELFVIEMGLVSPPRLLDFGKAYLDRPGDYPDELLREHLENCSRSYSPEDWSRVLDAYQELKSYQIYYYDLRPANVQVRHD
ncbi:hypothetical protein [Neorhodopirellula pilleata]|uniref:Uncharacterized protein n=1 Tax=Neorhodopirellula pilleata TaxID=2714738 RepID=A0A5C6ADR2_9BACT|nr:hypothetical protein [Neorhodopirellula pilleata]TWT97438.1 hypothetical protein Pla100_25900 [Neorhodopirellula pilleata]